MRKMVVPARLVLTALLLTTAQARPQAQDGPGESRVWQPSLEKDKWRAFQPEVQVSRDRWWEMRQDDHLWQLPKTAGKPTSSSPLQHGGHVSPSNQPSMTNAPSSTPAPAAQSQPEVRGTSSIASQVAAIAAAAKALLQVKKTNSTTVTSSRGDNKSLKPEPAVTPDKDGFPGETGYLRPFYSKGDNNPFVDEGDMIPFYGGGMTLRNGRPYLPVLHKESTSSPAPVKPAQVNGSAVVEGGVPAGGDLPILPSRQPEERKMNDASIGLSGGSREQKMTEPEISGSQKATEPISKKQKPGVVEKQASNEVEPPQADQPFEDWPTWDSSLFDDFQDDDSDDKGKDVNVPAAVTVEKNEKSDEKVKEVPGDKNKVQAEADSKDGSDESETQKAINDADDDDYDYDEDYDFDFDEDDFENDDDSDDEDNDSEDEDDDEQNSSDDDEEDDDDEAEEESSNDDDDNDSREKVDATKSSSGSGSDGSSSNTKIGSISEDDYDDSYYYDDEDDEDGDWKEDSYEVVEKPDGAITISPIKTSTSVSRVASRKKRLDWEKMPQLSHGTHYDKGVIYDAPSHHGEVSLSKNVNMEKGPGEGQGRSESGNSPTMIHLEKAKGFGGSATQFEPTKLHTESDASTSPNPRPPIVTGAVSQTTTTSTTPSSTTTTATSTTTTTNSAKPAGMEGYLEPLPVSYPLEFCQGDFECRAGRTCSHGMCKCVPVSWCEHSVAVEEGFLVTEETDVPYLPVCGTDGKRYRSHCHLHREACVTRKHTRVDRHGLACSGAAKSDQTKELPVQKKAKSKSWLMEQERLLQEGDVQPKQASAPMMADQPVQTPPHSDTKIELPRENIVHFPTPKAEITSSVKKDGGNVLMEGNLKRPLPAREKCTWSQMNEFKEALLSYYCHKFVEPNCLLEVKTERQYLSMLMYSYFDKDFDYFLTAQELQDKERDEHFDEHIVRNCHLQDFVKFADTMGVSDGKLTITEFSKAFELMTPTQHTPTKIEVISTLASAGNGLELKCGIDSDAIIWQRQGAKLSDDKHSHQLMVFDDGALFFSNVGLHHIGNYTCMDAEDPSLSQLHRLRVQTIPKITVNPITQSSSRGLDIELKCHAEGIPKPTLHWTKGDTPLHTSDKTSFYYNEGHVVIHEASPEYDAGTYTCVAHNQAGTTRKSVSVSVLEKDAPMSKESFKEAGTFVVFHRQGITAYDPMHCVAKHKVNGGFGNFKFIPDAMEEPLTLCKPDTDCLWGSAVRVGSKFIYASQPDQNRVVVMEASGSWRPLQVVDTDERPGKMWYVPHLDQVWVLCEGKPGSSGTNIIVVIRDASEPIQQRAVHTRPVGNHFDRVQDLFIAPTNDLDHEFDYGYVAHKGQKGLFKINLEDMSYTKAVDLTSYGCVPTHVAFVPIGGHVVIQCVSASDQHSLQLILDYLTDTVTSTISLSGQPMTSPDSRHLITVDKLTGRVTVASISEEGLMATTYEVTVSSSISDVAFMPAATHPGYDLILTSADDDDVIIMNLVTGKVEKISGSRYATSGQTWHPSAVKRRIATGDSLSSFLMTRAMSSVDILDITFRQVECEFSNLESDVIIHVPSWQTS